MNSRRTEAFSVASYTPVVTIEVINLDFVFFHHSVLSPGLPGPLVMAVSVRASPFPVSPEWWRGAQRNDHRHQPDPGRHRRDYTGAESAADLR